LKPQLLTELSETTLQNLIDSEDYSISQKLDGRRLMLERSGLKVIGWGRSGLEAEVPKPIHEAFMSVRSDWIFDGELIKNIYHVFDVVKYPGGMLNQHSWIERQHLLKKVLTGFSENVKIVPQHLKPFEKQSLYDDCVSARAEGVVFCHIDSKYLWGIRSKRCFKYKFLKTIDCFIIDKSIDSKDNLVLGLYDDNGNVVDVGKVSALTGDGKHHEFQVGEVVTITYLYATESNRLYQPVRPKLRKDKSREECLMNQMIFKSNKIVYQS
jgi:bifunctional non-homologous end joining protein LigD